MSPRLQSVALSRWDVIFNCVTGAMKFAPPAPVEIPACPNERLGLVKALAIRLLDEGTANNYHEVAHINGVNPDSLKAAVSRERKRRNGGKREDAA